MNREIDQAPHNAPSQTTWLDQAREFVYEHPAAVTGTVVAAASVGLLIWSRGRSARLEETVAAGTSRLAPIERIGGLGTDLASSVATLGETASGLERPMGNFSILGQLGSGSNVARVETLLQMGRPVDSAAGFLETSGLAQKAEGLQGLLNPETNPALVVRPNAGLAATEHLFPMHSSGMPFSGIGHGGPSITESPLEFFDDVAHGGMTHGTPAITEPMMQIRGMRQSTPLVDLHRGQSNPDLFGAIARTKEGKVMGGFGDTPIVLDGSPTVVKGQILDPTVGSLGKTQIRGIRQSMPTLEETTRPASNPDLFAAIARTKEGKVLGGFGDKPPIGLDGSPIVVKGQILDPTVGSLGKTQTHGIRQSMPTFEETARPASNPDLFAAIARTKEGKVLGGMGDKPPIGLDGKIVANIFPPTKLG